MRISTICQSILNSYFCAICHIKYRFKQETYSNLVLKTRDFKYITNLLQDFLCIIINITFSFFYIFFTNIVFISSLFLYIFPSLLGE